jgi:hypothetical protein
MALCYVGVEKQPARSAPRRTMKLKKTCNPLREKQNVYALTTDRAPSVLAGEFDAIEFRGTHIRGNRPL